MEEYDDKAYDLGYWIVAGGLCAIWFVSGIWVGFAL
jgi:hypothetical protein